MYFGQGIEAVSAAKTKACLWSKANAGAAESPVFAKQKWPQIKIIFIIERNVNMSDISKFLADIQRIKKHVRADNGGKYDGRKVCEQISSLFASSNSSRLHCVSAKISDSRLFFFNILQTVRNVFC